MGGSKQTQATHQNTTTNQTQNSVANQTQNATQGQFANNQSNPWAPAAGVLQSGAGILQDYLKSPGANEVYSGARVAPMSADTTKALGMMGTSQGATDAMGFLKGVMNGGAGGMNPAVQQMQDAIRRQVQAATNANFSNAGMTGGTQHQGSFAKGMADGLAQPLFAAYENDMARKMGAANALPGIDQTRMGNQLGAGQIRDSYAQTLLDADRKKWEEQRAAPMRAWSEVAPYASQLGAAGSSSSSIGGGSQSSTGTNNTNSTMNGTSTKDGTTTNSRKPSMGSIIGGGLMAGLGLMTGNPMMALGGLGSGLGGGSNSSPLGSLFGGGGGGGASGAPWMLNGQQFAQNGTFDLNNLLRGR